MLTSSVNKRTKKMLYYNAENTKVFVEAIRDEARELGVNLARRVLDRSYDYKTNDYQNVEHLVESIVKDMRGWFSNGDLSIKEMDVGIHNGPWEGEFVRVQTRCKR